MSTTIDQKVVEMRFDNKHFESNVSTTMSTLDKLKQKLHLDGATKGLESVNAAANKVNMSGLGSSVETVSAKFSALQVMGVTALANITNSAVNAGKRIASALTIEPVRTGFSEYELKMDSVRTIMASTGETIDTVNGYLEELNKYSDQTIYSFSDMTQNIGKFTNAGVKLEDAVLAIKGISNEAALSGANANEAARAMYNFAQALSVGYIQRIDWKSIELANMATVEFKEQLLEAAIAAGTVKKKADGMYATLAHPDEAYNAAAMFTETLDDQWLTTEVLINTLSDYADETTDIGKRAYAAAQDVTKLTQMFDILKETAQSGWAKTWELLFGNLEEAKEFFTPITETLQNVITTFSDGLNGILGGALDSNWDKLISKINGAGVETSKYEEKIREVAKAHGVSSDEIDELIKKHGSLKKAIQKGAISSKILKEALDKLGIGTSESNKKLAGFIEGLEKVQRILGWGSVGDDVKALQTALEELGHSVGKCGIDGIIGPDTTAAIKEFQEAAGIAVDGIAGPETLAALKAAGTSVKELSGDVKETGESYEELIDNVTKKGGRALLLESVNNVLEAIGKILTTIGDAWKATFDPVTSDDVYGFIDGLNKLTESLIISDETAANFQRVMEGLFSMFKLATGVISKSFVVGVKVANAVLSLFGTDLMGVAATLADYIIAFRKWVEEHTPFINTIDKIATILHAVIEGIHSCVEAFLSLDVVSDTIERFKELVIGFFGNLEDGFSSVNLDNVIKKIRDAFAELRKWIEGLNDSDNIARDIIAGLVKGLKAGVTAVAKAIWEVASTIVTTICEFLGIMSPSRVMIAIGGFIIAGLIAGIIHGGPELWANIKYVAEGIIENFSSGIQNGATTIWNAIKTIALKVVEFISKVDFGALLATGIGVGMLVAIYKIANTLEVFAAPLKGVAKILNSVSGLLDSVSDRIKAKTFLTKAKAVLTLAVSIGILAGAVYMLAQLDTGKLWGAIGAVAVLLVMVGLLALLVVGLDALYSKPAFKKKDGGFGAKQALTLIAMAGSILLLAYAVQQIAKIGKEDLTGSLWVVAGMVIGLSTLMIALSALIKTEVKISRVGTMLFKISLSLLILVGVMKLCGMLSKKDILNGLGVITSCGLLFGALIAVSKLAGDNAKKAGSMLMKMSLSMLIMVGVIKLASMLTNDEVGRGLAIVSAVGVLFVALIAVSKLAGDNAAKAGGMMLMMSIALAITVSVIKQIAKLDDDVIKRGLVAIAALEVLFAGLIAVSKFAGQHAMKAGTMLLAMSVALMIVTGVIFILSEMNVEGLKRGLVIVSILELLFTGLIAATKNVPEKCVGALIVLTVAITLLSMAVVGLSFLDPAGLSRATLALSMIVVAFALLVSATKSLEKLKAGKFIGALSGLVAVVAMLALIVAGLSLISPDSSLLTSVAGVSALMLALSSMLYIFSGLDMRKLSASKMQKLTGYLAGLSVVLALLGLVLAMMSALNVSNAIPNAIALSILIASMSGALVILSKIGPITKNAFLAVLALAAMAVPLAAFVGVLALMQGVTVAAGNVAALITIATAMTLLLIPLTAIGMLGTSGAPYLGALALLAMAVPLAAFVGIFALMQNISVAAENVSALVSLATAMTLLLIPLTIVGAFGLTGAPYLGVLALLAMAVPMVAFVGILALMQNIQNAAKNVELLTSLMTTMTAVLVVLAIVGPFAAAGIAGIQALTMLMLEIGALAIVIGTLVQQFPALESFLDTGIPILEKLAYAIGSIVGNLIAGFAEASLSSLPEIGTHLSGFMTNASGFIEGAKMVDESVANGVKTLVTAVLALTAADILEGFAGWLTNGSSFAELGTQLSDFMTNAQEFITGAAAIDPSMVDGVKAIADTIMILTGANILEGLTSWLTGGSSLENFATQLPILGSSLSGFSSSLGTFTEDQMNTVNCAANAIKTLASVSAEIPNTGGLLGAIVGDNDLSVFAAQFPVLGAGLSRFLSNIGTFTDEQVSTVNCAADAIKTLAEASSEIPNTGGLLGAIVGDNDMNTFAAQFPVLGSGLAAFLSNVGTFTDEQVTTISCAANAIKVLAEASATIPNAGGWLAAIVGDNDLGTFAAQLPKVGEGIKGFTDKLGTFDDSKVSTVNSAVRAINALSGLANADLKGATKHLTDFGDDLPVFAEDIATFCSDMPSSESVSSAVSGLNKILSAVKSIADANSGALATFADNLKKVGKDAVDKFVGAFTSSSAKTDIKKAAKDLCDNAITGIVSKLDEIKTAGKSAAKKVVDGVGTQDDEMESAGKDLGSGLVTGINAKKQAAYDAGYALGQAAVQGEKDGQESNSPSKATMRSGNWLGEGLVIGIDQMGRRVYKAGSNMGETATKSISAAISRVSDMVNTDIDSQPTIRPVLDLSDVRAGAGMIGSILDTGSSFGVVANVGAISSMMNARGQNGGNGDVVSAINKLNKKMDNLGNTIYQIDGITYDDGSNISDAIRTITRVALRERRV